MAVPCGPATSSEVLVPAPKARVVSAVSRHPHEIGEVRQIVRQRCPGKDVPQVELVALHRVEIADKAGAGAHRHVDVAPARAGCGPAGPLGGTAGDVEEPRRAGPLVLAEQRVRVDRRRQPLLMVAAARRIARTRGTRWSGGAGRP
jgi:hypothetical protein